MFLDFWRDVESLLRDAMDRCGFLLPETEGKVNGNELMLETSPHADLASTISFRLAPILKRKPADISQKILEAIVPDEGGTVDRVEAMGPYLNFFSSRPFLNSAIREAEGDRCWTGSMTERVIVEHTSANPNGPLHVGHIRNSVIGDTLVRILRRAGCDVESQYYVNDMGRQIAIVVWGCGRYPLDRSKADHAIAKVYIQANKDLIAEPVLKEEVDRLMQLYEGGDEKTAGRFREAVEYALSGIEETLRRLNISHDTYRWESEFVRDGSTARIFDDLEATGLTGWEVGSLQLDLSGEGFEKKLVLKRSDGTSLYTTRDLAYHRWKADRSDRMIDVLGADHKLISGQLKAALRLMGVREPEIVIFEFVSLPTGSMSTRKGKFISTDELLDEVEAQAFKEVTARRPEEEEDFRRSVARDVALGAVRYDVVKVSPEKATTFDWKAALDFEKLSAPFIQYSHARACSILDKAGVIDDFDPGLLTGAEEVDLIRKISQFDLAIDLAARELKPHLLATYARELAESFNQFYRSSPVLEADPGIREARLALVKAARNCLRATLDTLGIPALESM
ncbi:arginine--tRNA ligase [Methanotrichaceae archaeon M04Ac]|uniref:Arginine--tRNA ligase n=1 Tax=Candidatus Methanocrinis alkalitolerans TaxID=3033395 RepID=A0ABT5XD42_9EURY|nr:arginine--tRNA ligase [Candidatus Methanocrinis alkalitolerans]MCR3884558.1 arginine--tRNA ligase [Methanothrix sp.]MDF0592640.1 arginine--tRNA ligase [Candidatus Methanocrinis alkalitolerans]